MDIKDLLARIDTINEAANPAQQAAIAIAMKKAGKKPKTEDAMASAEQHATGPKFTGYWKGTDKRTPGKHMVGSSESILRDLERKLDETPVRDLMREYREFVAEYGGVGGYGAASQSPQGTTGSNQQPDPKELQQKLDQEQIQKNTNTLTPLLKQQGAKDPMNAVKFQGVMNKLDDSPNTDLNNQDQKQLGPLAVAASKALQDPSTANQLKQLITKASQNDQKKQMQVKQAELKAGENNPADAQNNLQQQQQQQQQPGQQLSAGKPQ